MKFFRSRSASDNLLSPVKSSVKYITRGGTKVWGSITRKRKSAPCQAITEPSEKTLHLSLTEFPKQIEKPELLSTSLHSSISVTKSTDQKHYTCLSPVELSKIKSKTPQIETKLTPLKPPRRNRFTSPSNNSKLTYEEFSTTARSSTPMEREKRSQSLIVCTSKIIEGPKVETTRVVNLDIFNDPKKKSHDLRVMENLCANNEATSLEVMSKDITSRSELLLNETDIPILDRTVDQVTVEDDDTKNESKLDTRTRSFGEKGEQSENFLELNNFISEFKSSHGKSVFDSSVLKDAYQLVEKISSPIIVKDLREELIKEKFIVNLYESPYRKKSVLSTPICKNREVKGTTNKLLMIPSAKEISPPKVTFFEEEHPITPPVSCGKPDKLNISFNSSVDSEDSVSALLTDNEEENDDVFEKSHNHTKNFELLREKRNQVCSTIRGVSKALSILRTNKERTMDCALIQAERVLLLSTERCRVYTENIMNSKYITKPKRTTVTVTISKISIPLKSGIGEIYSDTYFMCLVCSDVTILATKCVQLQGKEGKQYIHFYDDLVFEGLAQNFRIYVKVYYFQSKFRRQRRKRFQKIFPKKTVAHPVKIYHYDDLLTSTSEKNDFFLPAFKQCAVFEISEGNLSNTNVYNYFPNSIFYKSASITKTLSNIKMNVEKKGLLNFGQRYGKNEVIIWNIKYVVLRESELRIYNSPSDDKALVKIDLRNVASDLVTHSCHLKNCFQLDIVYDEDPDFENAFKFPYFLRANTCSEFKIWSSKLNYVINRLKQWHMLPFLNKHINY